MEFDLEKYSHDCPIWSYGPNESKYPGTPLFSAILVAPEAYKHQP